MASVGWMGGGTHLNRVPWIHRRQAEQPYRNIDLFNPRQNDGFFSARARLERGAFLVAQGRAHG